ncbi:nucleoside 2-deoxyribosyltransferase [Microbacterium sp. ISL-103]|uniref:PfkB family carbohydrate kinase n=1 Tax=Microbacterium sp. ISL-103 TaxID=2819156 RepID=UPI001BEBDDF5|nr:PfkB family carbohydrate kinase [Microbacterium sp. ISL-103]MBT2474873.1 nucleoside 2-deoxyribosyltransferase [Microbacterium sp. ISL-103]
MIVVGGSYLETVLYPTFSSTLIGSGVRAASTLGTDATHLVTIATPSEAKMVSPQLAATTKLQLTERGDSVDFRYLDLALPPQVVGLPASMQGTVECDFPDDDVLAFGLAELPEGYPVTARRVVVDPQSPGSASARFLEQIDAEQIAVCANRKEARLITGLDDPMDAARALLDRPCVKAVVVKCGALGYVVADASAVTWVHATPSLLVRALGSGDVFSAVFAREWFAGVCAADAASTASAAVASSATGPGTSPPRANLPLHPGYAPKVYLAGPFFTLAERWLVERVRSILAGIGARVFSPIHDVGPGDIEVAQKDLDGLDSCDVVLALLDGFDPGTIYETGWAARESIPIVGFASEQHSKETKMLVGMGAEVHSDLTTALYRAVWAGQGLALTPGIDPGRSNV